MQDMLVRIFHHMQLPFHAMLMDTWYAAKGLMLYIDFLHKIYYSPLRDNHQIHGSERQAHYQRVTTLTWRPADLAHGKTIKIKGFPKMYKVKLFSSRCLHTARTGSSPTT